MRPAVAVVVAGWLIWFVSVLGARPLPAELSPLKPMWNFTDAASPWMSRNGRVLRTPEGLMVTPAASPAMISSGQIEHDPAAFERMRVRLKTGDATQGRIGLVLRGRDGSSRVLAPFDVPGGGAFADVEVSLPVAPGADVRVVEVLLVPSLAIQPAVVASISFEPDDPWLVTTVKELWSPSPGEATALSGFTMHTLPPPVINGQSAWGVLIPVALFAGILARFTKGESGVRAVVRRCGWAVAGAVWGIGLALLFYHQTVALAVDVERFGDRSRDDAYHMIDGVPLWDDMREVARQLAPGSTVEFVTPAGEDPVVSALWKGRAAYYLAPIPLRSSGVVRLRYYGGPHPPCEVTDPDRHVFRDSERFCLFGPPS